MPKPGLRLVNYYAAVDADDLEGASEMLHPHVSFALHLPAGVTRGSTREELIGYLTGRGVVRRHVPLRTSRDDDLEFVYGAVVEDESRTTGHFLASVRVDPDGRIGAYHVSFDPTLALAPASPATEDDQ